MTMFRSTWAILLKECREILRDPVSLAIALLLPIPLLLLFTYGLNLDVTQVRLAVLDMDRSAQSEDFVRSMRASGDIQLTLQAASYTEVSTALDRGQVHAGLIIPPGFGSALSAKQPSNVEVLVDGSYPPQARATIALLDAATAFYNHRLLDAEGAQLPHVQASSRVWYNPTLRSVNFVVPGLFGLIIVTLSPLLSTLAVVRERERGSIQQILVAPVSRAALILGKALPYGGIAMAQLVSILVFALVWFAIPFEGSMLLFLVVGAVLVLCTVSIGLLVSTITRSQVVAMLLALAMTIMPSFLFSGFLFPVYTQPARYQIASLAFPARHFTEIARGIALKGAGVDQLWPHITALAGITIIVLFVAVSRFHRRMG